MSNPKPGSAEWTQAKKGKKGGKKEVKEVKEEEWGGGWGQPTTVYDKEYQEDGADLLVVSSDDVHFKVHSFFLMAASPVMRGMIQDCTAKPAEIRLTDPDIETSSALRLLLDLACNKPIEPVNMLHVPDVLSLIRLADKWEFTAITRTIALLIAQSGAVGSTPVCHPHLSFFYACALDRLDIAHSVLPGAASLTWTYAENKDSANLYMETGGACVLDVTRMTPEWIDRLPRKYFIALLRAWRLRTTRPEGSWQQVADDFKKQVEAQNAKK